MEIIGDACLNRTTGAIYKSYPPRTEIILKLVLSSNMSPSTSGETSPFLFIPRS